VSGDRRHRAALVSSMLPLAGLALGLPACGWQNHCEARGRVVMDAVPVESGSILFIPLATTDAMVSGGAIEAGSYRVVRGLMPGEYRVEIRCPRPSGKPIRGVPPGHPGPVPTGFEEGVAEQFNSQSTLRATLATGANVLDFQVAARPPSS
jgi:hypothetical protein